MSPAAAAPRTRHRAMIMGRAPDAKIVAPIALDIAARISERPLDAFHADPTQLTNGLLELHEAVHPDALFVTVSGGETPAQQQAAREAVQRLRTTLRDAVVLIAGLRDVAGAALQSVSKSYLEAGCDAIFFPAGSRVPDDVLRTLVNMARFFRAGVYLEGASKALSPVVSPWDHPVAGLNGLIVTDDEVPMSASIADLKTWVATTSA